MRSLTTIKTLLTGTLGIAGVQITQYMGNIFMLVAKYEYIPWDIVRLIMQLIITIVTLITVIKQSKIKKK